MKISTKGEYGLRAMLFIAMHAEHRSVTSHEIAQRQGIPEPYLRQILAILSKGGLIQSSRGPAGGHSLSRLAEKISLKQIFLTLEGQTTAIDQILALPCTIDVGTAHCVIREVFLEVKEAVENILSSTSLADLVARQRDVLTRQISIPLDLPGTVHARLPILLD